MTNALQRTIENLQRRLRDVEQELEILRDRTSRRTGWIRGRQKLAIYVVEISQTGPAGHWGSTAGSITSVFTDASATTGAGTVPTVVGSGAEGDVSIVDVDPSPGTDHRLRFGAAGVWLGALSWSGLIDLGGSGSTTHVYRWEARHTMAGATNLLESIRGGLALPLPNLSLSRVGGMFTTVFSVNDSTDYRFNVFGSATKWNLHTLINEDDAILNNFDGRLWLLKLS